MKKLLKYLFLITVLALLGANFINANSVNEYTQYRDIDKNTFNEYRHKMVDDYLKLRSYFQINEVINTTLAENLKNSAVVGYNYLPDDLINQTLLENLKAEIDRAIRYPNNSLSFTSIEKALEGYVGSINIKMISGNVAAIPTSGSAPLTVTFRADVMDTSGNTLNRSNYIWHMTNAGRKRVIGTGTSINHTFTEAGTYTVFLDVTSNSKNARGYTDVLPLRTSVNVVVTEVVGRIFLSVNGKTTTGKDFIKMTPEDGRFGIIFDASSSVPEGGARFIRTEWDFGNGVRKSYDTAPKAERIIYASEGQFPVSLKLTTNEGKTITKTFDLYVRRPIASINAGKDSGFIGDRFTFTAEPSGPERNMTYNWSIIDISKETTILSRTGVNLNHSFTAKGAYNVRLETISASGETDTDSIVIYINSRAPVANISIEQPYSNKPNTFRFDGSRSYDEDFTDNGKLRYVWKVNGQIVNLQNKNFDGTIGEYTFDSIGRYNVNLEVTDPDDQTTIATSEADVRSLLSLDFEMSPRVIQAGGTVNFTAKSQRAIFYEWNFGNGQTTSGQTATARTIYNQSGTYNVMLTVSDSNGNKNSFTQTVFVGEKDSPIADYKISYNGNPLIKNENACNGRGAFEVDRSMSLSFDGSPSVELDGRNGGLNYSWKIGNEFFTQATFNHTFSEVGCFPVRISVTSQKNLKTHFKDFNISVINRAPKVDSITIDIANLETDPVTVNLTATGANDPDGVVQSYLWYYYTDLDKEPQDYRSTTVSNTTFVLPKINGNYYFAVVLTDNDGAKTEIGGSNSGDKKQQFSVALSADSQTAVPILQLSADDTSLAVGETVNFTARAENILGHTITSDIKYSWDFDGDGFYDRETTEGKTSYSYRNSGQFFAKVRVSYRGYVATRTIEINVTNPLKADFDYISIGNEFVFINKSTGNYSDSTWKFGDGTEVSNQNIVIHTYRDGKSVHDVILEISENGRQQISQKQVSSNMQNIVNANRPGLSVFSNPVSDENGKVIVNTANDKFFVYVSTLGNSPSESIFVDLNTSVDANLNGGKDDDQDLKILRGVPLEIPLNNSKFQNIEIFAIGADGKKVGSKKFTIEKSFIEQKDFSSEIGAVEFIGISDEEKQMIEQVKNFVMSMPEDKQQLGLNYILKLKEEWNNPIGKSQTLYDLQVFIGTSGVIGAESINTILDNLIVFGQADKSNKQVRYQSLVDMLPQNLECTPKGIAANCNEYVLSLLTEIKDSPNNSDIGKQLGNEILAILKENGNKFESDERGLNYIALLKMFVYGDSETIPEDEKQDIIDQTPEEPKESTTKGWLKKLLWIVAGILGFLIIGTLAFILFNTLTSRRNDKNDILAANNIDDDFDLPPPPKKEEFPEIKEEKKIEKISETKKEQDIFKDEPKDSDIPDWLKDSTSETKNISSEKKTEIIPEKIEEKFADPNFGIPEKIPDSEAENIGFKPVENPDLVETGHNDEPEHKKLDEFENIPEEKKGKVPSWLTGAATEQISTTNNSQTFAQNIDNNSSNFSQNLNNSVKKAEDFVEEKVSEVVEDSEEDLPDWLKGSFIKPEEKNSENNNSDKKSGNENGKDGDISKIEDFDFGLDDEITEKTEEENISEAVEDSEEDIPDWLKGAFDKPVEKESEKIVERLKDERKTENDKEFEVLENSEENEKVKEFLEDSKLEEEKAKKATRKKSTAKKDENSKDDESSAQKKNSLDEIKEKTGDSTLWDDGMGIPNWLKDEEENGNNSSTKND